jgi:H+-transporting ATPase
VSQDPPAGSDQVAVEAGGPAASGLSSSEVWALLEKWGPNSVPEPERSRLREVAAKFWAPVPWLLELAIVLELLLRDLLQALVFAVLLVVNAGLAAVQEGRAQAAVRLLRQRLQVSARVRRDGEWTTLPVEQLVPGDLVHLRQGDIVPADLRLQSGEVQLDQSTLTGEALAVSGRQGDTAYAGSVVLRGEADGVVTATGVRSYFGRTTQLVATARAPGNIEHLIFGIVRALISFSVAIVLAAAADGLIRHLPLTQLVPFALILLIAAVPVALPATFTLATALGSRELAQSGALVTRLAAIEDAAGMEVLCTDKTGTLTQNRLALESVLPLPPYRAGEVLQWAAAASQSSTQDPLDLAILRAVADRGEPPIGEVTGFTPFEPATKRSEATVVVEGAEHRVVKGATRVVAELAGVEYSELAADVDRLASSGARVLGVAVGEVGSTLRMAGLVALADPPREDAASLVQRLGGLGIHVVMVTGDGLATAAAIAERLGLGRRALRAAALRTGAAEPSQGGKGAGGSDPLAADVYAEVLPEDKLLLVSRLQAQGMVVGMTGDGVNDAPALRKAEVGIAVASATDVAKAAASLVLTDPGLGNIVAGVEVSRRIHQRMLTYTLNKIIKTLQVSIFLGLGLIVLGTFVTTPTLVVLLLLANDFLTMSIATDRVRTPRRPQRWGIRPLVWSSLALAIPLVALSFGVWELGLHLMGLGHSSLQTLSFVWLVVSGQATVYLVRQREHFWHAAPSRWLAASSGLGLAVVLVLAWGGWLMSPVPAPDLGVLLLVAGAYMVAGDLFKAPIFRWAGLRR